ncbi:winged helix-turn-helix transcriptional regulator [Streptomyces sp. NPDC093589]|uniref:winged helix-turn-helix transcriptional regulator n=1 Tax=Streptomyces sp. NPDC093589 TaxID=3366043 RepID=UPI0038148A9D
MATTGLPPVVDADLARVTESLEMISHRWSVWVLMTLSAGPLRYAEIKPRLPWLADSQLTPKLRKLSDAGLIQRTAYSGRHVTYGLTDRGTDLMPVLTVIAAWGDTHLEQDVVRNRATGELEPGRIAPAQNIEDTIALLAPRHATAILWVLKERRTASARSLANVVMPAFSSTNIYPPLRQLADDGLVEAAGEAGFQLSESGAALAPLFRSVSAWATGRAADPATPHPVWGQAPAPSRAEPGRWITHQTRIPAPPTALPANPAPSPQTAPAAWQSNDLFSHQIPACPLPAAPAGGRRR